MSCCCWHCGYPSTISAAVCSCPGWLADAHERKLELVADKQRFTSMKKDAKKMSERNAADAALSELNMALATLDSRIKKRG